MRDVIVPSVIIASDRVVSREERARLDRMMQRIDAKVIVEADSAHIPFMMRESGWNDPSRRTGQKRKELPSIIFSGFDWEDPRNDPMKPKMYVPSILGRDSFADFRDKAQLLKEKGVACNSAYEIHTAFGCFHSCSYCHVGNYFTIMLDIEKFIGRLDTLIEQNPWQRLYKYDNQSDINFLEPEYGATQILVEHFAKKQGQKLMLYTKSDNVDFLEPLDHNNNTIVCWTISCDDVAEKYEPGTPSLDRRLDAARKCQDWGYEVRFRFSPIIPVKGWKKKNKEMIDKVFSCASPSVISIETLCHMSAEQCEEMFPGLALRPQRNPTEYELFSHRERKRIYGFFLKNINRQVEKRGLDTKVALCLETLRMWQDLDRLLKQDYRDFYCCCGARCA